MYWNEAGIETNRRRVLINFHVHLAASPRSEVEKYVFWTSWSLDILQKSINSVALVVVKIQQISEATRLENEALTSEKMQITLKKM